MLLAFCIQSSGVIRSVMLFCSTCCPSLTFTLPPAGCSPVAAELNHCEHGRNSLFTCELSPAAAQRSLKTSICWWRVCLCVSMQMKSMGVSMNEVVILSVCVWRGGMRSWEGCCFSSCQPLEIPGNVIQSCSLKNHSARNSPGQQRRLGESKRSSSEQANIWIINTKIELLCHLYPWCIVSPVTLSRKSSLLYVSVKYEVRRLNYSYVLCIHTWLSSGSLDLL